MQTILTVQGGHAFLKLIGRFDMKARPEFMKALEEAKAENPQELMIDLREVTFVDSSGVGQLIVTSKKLETSSIRLTLCCQEGQTKDILDLMKVGEMIPMVSST